MTDRSLPITTDQLEAALADLASDLAFPPTPDVAGAVGARLRARPVRTARPRPIRRTVVRSLLLAAAIALLVVGAALAVRLGLDLLSVEVGALPPQRPPAAGSAAPAAGVSAAPSERAMPGVGLGLGMARSLEEARTEADFEILEPTGLGPPDAVYLGGPESRGQVAFLYAASETLPASDLLAGAGLLVTQNRGEPDDGLAHKLLDAKLATVTQVVVDDAPGLWISGEPHVFWYLAPDGTYIEESRRLVGDTLAWERDGMLYRIEGAIPLEQALDIARSMR